VTGTHLPDIQQHYPPTHPPFYSELTHYHYYLKMFLLVSSSSSSASSSRRQLKGGAVVVRQLLLLVTSTALFLSSSLCNHQRSSTSLSSSSSSSFLFCHALRHNFYTKDDHRTFIGPLGFPFGFLEKGHYNLTVYDFQLSAPDGDHDHDVPTDHTHGGVGGPHKTTRRRSLTTTTTKTRAIATTTTGDQIDSIYDEIKGVGFLLKPFRDEAIFNRYMAYIKSNTSRCIFQKYLDRSADDGDDMDYYNGDGMMMHDDDSFYLGDSTANVPYDDDVGNLGGIVRRLKQQQQRHGRLLVDGATQVDADSPEGVGESTTDLKTDGLFFDMMSRSRWSPHHTSAVYDFKTGQAGYYFLMYQICFKDGVNISQSRLLDIHSQFELDFHFSNTDMFGRKSYLSAGEMILPHLFLIFFILYGICLFLWMGNIRLIKEGKPGYFDSGIPPESAPTTPLGRGVQAPTVSIYPIHYLMGFLLTLKTLSLFAESIRYHYLRVTGNAVFWSAVYYTFVFLKVSCVDCLLL
jgi:hypothetical protein